MPCESKMEEKCEEKEECARSFDALDDDLINDMSNGDAQMRRLVRHRLNAQQEKADAAYVKRLLREERFAKGQARTNSDADRRLAALAQREEMKDCEARLEQEEADAKVAARLDRELKDGDAAKCAQLEVDGELDFEHGLAEAKGLEAAKRLDARIAVLQRERAAAALSRSLSHVRSKLHKNVQKFRKE